MTFIDSWDSGQPGAKWDSGLQWDINVGPATGDVSAYLALVAAQHRDKPKFIAYLTALLQPICDQQVVARRLQTLFNLDDAEGVQLDIIGEWIGVTRELSVPLENVYFSFDIDGLGFGQGTWKGRFDPTAGLVSLPDDAYRTLLRAKAANNGWDGTIPTAYQIWDTLFAGTGYGILIQNQTYPIRNVYFSMGDELLGFGRGFWASAHDPTLNGRSMHMLYALTGPEPDAVTKALFTGGYLNMKPATVKIDGYLTKSVPDFPYFGFGVTNDNIAGFGEGAFADVA
jgi:hypothetical protein